MAAVVGAGGVDRVVVVDNGGDRDRSDLRAAIGDRGDVLTADNHGYGAAANLGAARARELGADAVVLLNDDVVVAPGWLEPLAAELAGDRVGAVQPVLVTGGEVNSRGVTVGRDGAGHDLGRGEPVEALGDGPVDVELFTGGAVLLSQEFLAATGGFDERYFLYYEDVDLGLRGAELGWRYRLVPSSRVEHAGGVTTGGEPDRTRFLQERNRLWAAFRFADAATIGRALWLSVRRVRHRPHGVHVRALLAGLAGAPRRLRERRGRPASRRSPAGSDS